MTEKQIQAVATSVAAKLFMTGSGERATRMILVKERYSGELTRPGDLGGWGVKPTQEVVAEAIRVALSSKRTKAHA